MDEALTYLEEVGPGIYQFKDFYDWQAERWIRWVDALWLCFKLEVKKKKITWKQI